MTEPPVRVALLGAGYIADTHAEVLHGLPGTAIVAVVDPARGRAEALARRWRIPSVLEDPAALGGGGVAVDVAHVLTPPALHRAAAEPLLRRGIHVLIEKPMAVDEAECESLEEAAERGGARLRVNHNSVHHPAFARLRRDLARGAVGRPRHVELVYIVQLRQLAAGQLGHWMFRSPANLLLEQAVHPLSQLEALLGPPQELVAVPEPPRRVGAEATLVTGWRIVGRAACGASFGATVVIGHSQPFWRVRVVGSDGVLESDVLRNGYQADRPTPWLEAVDDLVVGTAGGLRRAAQAAGNALAYAGGQLGARGRSDAFFASMRASVAAAHADFRARGPEPRPSPGRRLVALIGRVAAAAAPAAPAPAPAPAARRGGPAAALDVLLLGGTGFIGRQLAARLVARGRRVGVLARQLDGLPAVFADPNVTLVQGDVADAALVPALVARAPVVVHLAHGGGGDWPSIERAMVGGARLVGSATVAAGARRLIFVSSIAALYLGDPGAVVDPSTPPDPEPEARAPYARGKIASEAALRALRERDGLPLTVVRPGLVVGPGTSPFHGGIGLFNRETHCIGWNGGSNPLPLVLVSDAAAALLALVERPDAAGPVHNLVGDVRLSARDYLASLARATGRPLVYHPRSAYWNAVVEGGKWAVKRAGGRRAARTTLRDLRSRGLAARFDTRRERAELAWNPVADRERFLAEAFADVV